MSSRKHGPPAGSSKCHKCDEVLTPIGPRTRRRSLDSPTCKNCHIPSGKSPKVKTATSGASTRRSKTSHRRDSDGQGLQNESENQCKECEQDCDGYCDGRENKMLINPAFAQMKRSRAGANIGEEDARVVLDNKKIESLRERLRVEDGNRQTLKLELDDLEAENAGLHNNLSKIKKLHEDW